MALCENEPYDGPLNVEMIDDGPDDNPDIPDDFENSFAATLNGQAFIVNNIYILNSTDAQNNNFIAITGAENNYHSIILYLPTDIAVGTYTYSPETIVAVPNLNVTYSNLADLQQSGIGNGHIIITEHNTAAHRINGTFACTVNAQNGNTQHITQGSFDVIY